MYSSISRSIGSKRCMFALIIGIDDYAHCQKLRGAVADAKAMVAYLEEDLCVPQDHIRTLLNYDANRDAIIKTFQDLKDDRRIKEGDPIVIFYAGHGAEVPAPPSWGSWGPENMIQSLLPQDYEDPNIRPIPDRTIGALIEDIAKVKGNNISVLFDCCHSASGTRVNNKAYVPRTVHLNSVIPADLDWDIWQARAGKVATGFAYHGLQSHVLLAACGEKELAYEYEGRGQFTTALLETLRRSSIDDLTYSEVIERIHLSKQSPQCEGFNQHRVVFDMRVPAGRRVHYSVHINDGSRYVIGAGLAQGISHGVELTLYNDRKRTLGSVVVDDSATIEDFQTTVTGPNHLANPAFAKLTHVGKLPLYLTPGESFSRVLEETLLRIQTNGNTSKFRLVEEAKEAKLEVAMERDLVVLKVLDQGLKQYGLMELSFRTPFGRLTHALDAAAHYYWYLDLISRNSHADTKDGVTVDFYLLQESETEYDKHGLACLVPLEPNLCRRDQSPEALSVIDFVIEPEGLYGIKITNNTMRNLYLNAFLFNNASLSIFSYYTQSSAGTPEAPLKRNGEFTIGYGPGGATPFTYSLEEGQDIDVGYLKIFFATWPVDLTDVAQLSPFSDTQSGTGEDTRKAKLVKQPAAASTHTWFTLNIPVVQRRQKVPGV